MRLFSRNAMRRAVVRSAAFLMLVLTSVTTAWAASQPKSCLDFCQGRVGNIFVNGWTFDPDVPSASIDVHVYVYRDAACKDQYLVTNIGPANVSRPDVNQAFGITGNHGFNTAIPISDSGTFYVKVFAIDANGNGNPQMNKPYTAVTVTANAGKGTTSDPYVIGSAADWAYFANEMSDRYTGSYFAKSSYKLTADIGTTLAPVTTTFGTSDNPFSGHFYGNRRTMTVDIDTEEDCAAPFSHIKNATIENLTVAGSVSCRGNNNNHCSGLVGACAGANTITGCSVSANVAAVRYCGGMVGHGGSGQLTMEGCVYSGTISGFANFAGGLLGWCDNLTLNINNCLFKGSFSSSGQYHPIALCYKKSLVTATVANALYLYTTPPNITSSGTNNVITEGIPVSPTYVAGEWVGSVRAADGNTYYKAFTISDLDGSGTNANPFIIHNAAEWTAVANAIASGNNSAQYASSCYKLADDFKNGTSPVTRMIGTSTNKFSGTFDGNGRTLTVNLNSSDMFCAPFNYVKGATIKSLHTNGTVTASAYHASGLVGSAEGVTIQDCQASVNIMFPNGTGTVHSGGLIGHALSSPFTILNCLFDGSIGYVAGGTGTMTNVGGLVGWDDASTPVIVNSLNNGTFANPDIISKIARVGGRGTISNCYSTVNATSTGSQNDNRGDYTTAKGKSLQALLGSGWVVKGGKVVPKVFEGAVDDEEGTAEVVIGDIESGIYNSYLPIYSYYNYSYSQQIYNAEEIGRAGTITSMTLWLIGKSNLPDRTIDIYMKEVDKDVFTNGSDWETLDASHIVYSGTLTVNNTEAEAYIFKFDMPFEYSGNKSLLVALHSRAESWVSGLQGMVFGNTSSDPKRALYRYQDGQAFNPSNMGGTNGTISGQRNVVSFEIASSGAALCGKPQTLAVDNVTGHEAKLTWEGGSGTFNVVYRLATDTEWTVAASGINAYTYTFSGLTQNTQYIVGVQSVCDGGATSSYTTATFQTLETCPPPTDLTFSPTIGDGTKATFSWTENGTATAWQICIDGDVIVNAGTNPYTLDSFTPETTHTAKVRAVGNGEYSFWSNEITFTVTDDYFVLVNDGSTTNQYVPVYGFYCDKYSKCQFIIPATSLEDMTYGIINSLTFYSSTSSANWGDAQFEVYLSEVDNTTFESDALVDWDNLEKVKNAGSLSIEDGKMVVTLDNDYQYMGGNLLVGILQTTSGSFRSVYWYGVGADGRVAVGGYENSARVKANGPQKAVSKQSFLPKTSIAFTPGESSSCARPSHLTVNYTGGNTAEISWVSGATAWNINVNGTVTAVTTNPYTLTGLELATNYEVSVQADCGGGETSQWSRTASFTTMLCMPEDQCVINYELSDSYNDGWNGNAIQVVDVLTNSVLATLTISSGNSASGSLAVCNGRHIQFVWVNANYANECSYTFTDVNDDVIFSGHGALAAPVDYTVDCLVSSCKKPKDLALTSIPGPRSVELRWTPGTSDQDAWQICVNGDEANLVNVTTNPFTLTGLEPETTYTVKIRGNCGVEKSGWSNEVTFTTDIPCPVPTNVYAAEIGPNTATLNWTCVNNSFDVRYGELVESSDNTVASWLQYDNSTISTNIGSSNGGTWTWGVKYTDNLVTGKRLTKVSIFESSEHTSSDITINIYEGGDDAPETLIHTQVVKPVANDTFHEVELSSPVNITRGKNLWITLTATGTYVMAACLATEANNQWISNQGEWTNMANLNAKLAVYGWMIRACMEVPEVDFDAIVWTTAAATGSTYELTGLQPLTNYVAQVRGNYGADGNSEWETTRFITIVANPIAKDVNVVAAQTAANISWKGYSDSYKVRYRTSLKENTSFFDDFEDDLDQWTIYTEGDTPFPKGWVIYDSGVASQGYVASAWSWYDYTAYDASNWLVTPQLSLRGNLKFKEYVNAKYPDKYEVLLSTTGNAINDFTITLREMAASAGNWGEVNIDLSNYEGQQGYIAIHHRDSDYNYLYIDDFGIFLEPTPASNWTEIVTNETNVTLTGLTPGTKYDFQIIGITDGAENAGTDIASFTTIDGSQNVDIDLADNADNSTTLSTYRGQSANVTLSGRRFYTNGTWNTLCLPFDLNAAQLAESSIAGATVKELDIAAGTYPHVTAVDKGTLYLNFKEVTSIEAGKPYIAKLTDTSEYLDDPTFSGVVIPDTYTDAAAITAALADKAVTSTDGKVTFLGTYTPVTYNAEDKSVVFLSDGGTVNYLWANGQKTYTLNAFRAYFQVNPSASTYVLNFGDGETTTGICDNEATRSDDDTWYDMSGRKVANRQSINRTLPKGVYVKNGRKIVVK